MRSSLSLLATSGGAAHELRGSKFFATNVSGQRPRIIGSLFFEFADEFLVFGFHITRLCSSSVLGLSYLSQYRSCASLGSSSAAQDRPS